MRRLTALAVAGWFLAALAAGDTVHLRDGRKLIGTTRQTRDGKIEVEMRLGTVVVDPADVIFIERGTKEPTAMTAPAWAGSDEPAPPARRAGGRRTWSIHEAALPEPIVFMLTRQLELVGEDPGAEGVRDQLKQWRIAVHDGKRRFGDGWITRSEQAHRRAAYIAHLAKAADLFRQARSIYGREPGDLAKRTGLEEEARAVLAGAAQGWPDPVIRGFLLGTLELRDQQHVRAEQRFVACAEAEPLVAAFHQGRGVALLGTDRPLRALEEFIVCLELCPTEQAYQLIQDAMKAVPGAQVKDPTYLRAKELLGQYRKPDRPYQSYGGRQWMMPSRRTWQSRDDTLLVPPWDRLIVRQALAVPVVAEGLLLVDKEAVAGAEVMYLEVAPGKVAQARQVRYWSGKAELPVAVIGVPKVTFTAVDAARPAALKADQRVTIQAVNLHAVMGDEIRAGEAAVVSAGKDGARLSAGILPGETLGAVFADGQFAGLLTGRTNAEAEDCGRSVFVNPADLAAAAAALAKSAKSALQSIGYGSGYGALKPQDDAPATAAEGKVFLLHILLGEEPPKQSGK